jgi:two-component system, NtrC family, sensor kinase
MEDLPAPPSDAASCPVGPAPSRPEGTTATLCGVRDPRDCPYRGLADSVSDAVFELDADGRMIFMNAAGQARFGYAIEDFPSWDALVSLMNQETRDRARDLFDLALHGKGGREEFVLIGKDLRPVPVSVAAQGITRFGRRSGVRCIVTDISDRRRAELADRESARWFDLALHASPAPTALVEMLTARFIDANVRFLELLGYTREQLIGHTPDELALWTDPDARQRYVAHVREFGSARNFETTVQTRAGAIRHVLVSAESLTWRGRPCSLSVYYDISEQKHLQVQQLQSQKLEAIGQLAAGIAHEINTPIQFVGDNLRFLQESFTTLRQVTDKYRAFIEAVQGGRPTTPLLAGLERALAAADVEFLDAEVPDALSQSLEGVNRVARIVRAMKEFAHPDAGEKAPADINAAIDSTVTVARNEWKYVADVSLSLEPNLPLVSCLIGELNQVLLNLLVNAAHAIADTVQAKGGKGLITITTRSDGGWVEISVADSGVGIPDEVKPRIFDPFFTTKPVGKGTGQGLAIARAVVEKKHGGILRFESEVGRGTTFFVRLPRG